MGGGIKSTFRIANRNPRQSTRTYEYHRCLLVRLSKLVSKFRSSSMKHLLGSASLVHLDPDSWLLSCTSGARKPVCGEYRTVTKSGLAVRSDCSLE